MNPLKLRLHPPGESSADHIPENNNTNPVVPSLAEIQTWLAGLPTEFTKTTAPEILGLLRGINRRSIPSTQRLQTLTLLQPCTRKLIDTFRARYRNSKFPLEKNQREYAVLNHQILDEMAIGYKLLVNETICDIADEKFSHGMFLLSLRQAIEQLGLLLLEAHLQYAAPPESIWGELNRLYEFAERNALSTMEINSLVAGAPPLTTIQHTYLRVVLLSLTQPNHLMSGQVEAIYQYLETWTAGCRMEERKGTAAEAGDMLVDLASNRPPVIATGYTRFRPVKGRYLDISRLRERMAELQTNLHKDETEQTTSLSLKERMRRDMLLRLSHAWEGRGERHSERYSDDNTPVLMAIGLNAAHHQASEEADFNPEEEEISFHRPATANHKQELSLMPTQDPLASSFGRAQHTTRLSQFDSRTDVWDTVHNTEIMAREQRQATLEKYRAEPWRRINHSRGGLALQRHPNNRHQMQVGSLVAFRDNQVQKYWRIGVIRWLQDNTPADFEIGIMALADKSVPVGVRAIGGSGSGGEYFRSLLIIPNDSKDEAETLIVPASIYHVGTQLVLNRGSEIQYAQLTDIIETTGSFSLFAFDFIDMPDHERNRLKSLGQQPPK